MVTPLPTLIVFVVPSIVTEADPTVRMPVTLTSPSTYNEYSSFAVVPIPTFLIVLIPTESTAQVPAAPTTLPLPVTVSKTNFFIE